MCAFHKCIEIFSTFRDTLMRVAIRQEVSSDMCHRSVNTMKIYSVVLCVVFAVAACHLSEVDTTPVPPSMTYEDSEGDSESQEDLLHIEKISPPKNKIRRKRGIPCPRLEDTECDWEMDPPCGCDPCDAVRNANEARMLRRQHRKIVAEMKINRLKRKLHTAVCPSCALAHERQLEQKPCNKPHVDITVVVPGGNQHGINEVPVHESLPMVEYPPLPPHRQPYGSSQQLFASEPHYNEPMVPVQYEPVPVVPRPQYGYGPTIPETHFEPMVLEPERFEGFGPVPYMRSSVDTTDNEKKWPAEDVPVFDQDTKSESQKLEGLFTIFNENQNMSTTEEPSDSEEAWPWKNATYRYHETETQQYQLPTPTGITTEAPPYDSGEAIPFNSTDQPKASDSGEARPFNATGPAKAGKYTKDETSLRAPPIDDVLWQAAYLEASKTVASALNTSAKSLDILKSPDSSSVKRSCTGSQCLCLGTECLEKEVRQKRDTSTFASVLLTGLVSAIIGV